MEYWCILLWAHMYVSSMDNLSNISNLSLVKGDVGHSGPDDVIAETFPQGDTEYVFPSGAAVENHPEENTGQVSPGGGGGGSLGRVTPHPCCR